MRCPVCGKETVSLSRDLEEVKKYDEFHVKNVKEMLEKRAVGSKIQDADGLLYRTQNSVVAVENNGHVVKWLK